VDESGPSATESGGRRAAGAAAVCQLVVEELSGETLRVSGPEGKHLVRSLRAGPGESWWATDGRGTRARLEILRIGRKEAVLRVAERVCVPVPARRWWLATAAAATRLDWLVEKATELGAWALVPLEVGGRSRAGRAQRWGRLARAALGQCLGAWTLQVAAPVSLEDVLKGVPGSAAPWAGRCIADPLGAPAGARPSGALPEGDLLLLVGPPEGFSPRDKDLLAGQEGLWRLRLGNSRLRSETAALAALVWARLGEDRT
jgi:16S rRNA (uracil1498-N3)-methyltransferase